MCCKMWISQCNKIDFFKLSQEHCKWSLNVFSPELTLVRCFFSRGFIKVKVSATLKNPLFFMAMLFFAVRARYTMPKICLNKVCSRDSKNQNPHQKFEKMLESYQEISKLSVDSFMDSYDLIVPQKWDFPKKSSKSLNNISYPPCLSDAVICKLFRKNNVQVCGTLFLPTGCFSYH